MKKGLVILISLILVLFVVNYSFLDSLLINFFDEDEVVIVGRVIDGDTIVIENISVRLLGINSPERGEPYYEKAKEFLEERILNKTVRLKFGKEKYDKYDRLLVYVFVDGENVNLELVKNGFANFYFPSGKDNYYSDFKKAWDGCRRNLCERSKETCADCIELEEFNYKEEIVGFYNKCEFDCELTGWEIKDEGRKNFLFPEFVLFGEGSVKVIVAQEDLASTQKEIFWIREDYVWTNSGDTLFLRNREGKLVLWESY